METPTQTAAVRKDIQERELGVPVGEKYYHGKEPLPYRWIGKDDDEFQVFFEGEWVEAQSIDFDFD